MFFLTHKNALKLCNSWLLYCSDKRHQLLGQVLRVTFNGLKHMLSICSHVFWYLFLAIITQVSGAVVLPFPIHWRLFAVKIYFLKCLKLCKLLYSFIFTFVSRCFHANILLLVLRKCHSHYFSSSFRVGSPSPVRTPWIRQCANDWKLKIILNALVRNLMLKNRLLSGHLECIIN